VKWNTWVGGLLCLRGFFDGMGRRGVFGGRKKKGRKKGGEETLKV